MADLSINVDVAAVVADLELLAQASESSVEVRQRLLGLLDAGVEFVRIDSECLPTSRAGELTYRPQLADGLVDLVAAVRAGNV